jgi:exopolysaccharide production protein ExoZ
LWVCLFHAFRPLEGRPAPAGFGWLQAIAAQGAFGVQIFFVISGFCIGLRARQEWQRRSMGDSGGFLVDRLIRIVPVYHGAWCCYILLGIVLLPVSDAQWVATATAPGIFPESVVAGLQSLTLTEIFFGRFPFVRVSWTLTAELSYYALVAAGLELTRRTRCIAPALYVGVALSFGTAFFAVENPTSFAANAISGFRHFMCGFLVSIYLQPSLRSHVARPLAITGIVLLGVVGWWSAPEYWRGWAPALVALALLGAHPLDTWLDERPALKWLRACGVISYSLYLIHDPIVSRIMRFTLRLGGTTSGCFFLVALVSVVVAVLVARLFHQFVEAPVETWRKRSRGQIRRIHTAPLT